MSKGYSAYLCALARQIDREFEREANGIEVPYLKEEFIKWMDKAAGISEYVRKNYLHWITKLDIEFFTDDEDLFEELKKAFEEKDYDRVEELIKKYDDITTEWIEVAKKEKIGYPAKSISDWRSAFRKYAEFLRWAIQTLKNGEKQILIDKAKQSANNLFMRNQFIDWAIRLDNPNSVSLESSQTFASRIKNANKSIFCQTGKDYLALLPELVKKHDVENIKTMFDLMDKILTKRIKEKDESEMNLNELNNARSAYRLYAKFINSILTESK